MSAATSATAGPTDISDRTVFGLFAGIPTQRIDSDGFLGGVQGG